MPDIIAFLHHLGHAFIDVLELDDQQEVLRLEEFQDCPGEKFSREIIQPADLAGMGLHIFRVFQQERFEDLIEETGKVLSWRQRGGKNEKRSSQAGCRSSIGVSEG